MNLCSLCRIKNGSSMVGSRSDVGPSAGDGRERPRTDMVVLLFGHTGHPKRILQLLIIFLVPVCVTCPQIRDPLGWSNQGQPPVEIARSFHVTCKGMACHCRAQPRQNLGMIS